MSPAVSRLGRVAAVATLAAGTLGAIRQRAEMQATRDGRRVSAGPAGDPAPRRTPGRIATWFAAWVPARPRTPLGRIASASWAAPLTALGVLVAAAGGSVPRRDATRGCWVATDVRGPSRAALGAVGASANTIGRVVLVRSGTAGPDLLDHEAVHVRQAERLGPLLPVAYAWAAAVHGYTDNPFERAARAGARRAAALRGSRGRGPSAR